jgi:acyl-CoA oxidase
MTYSAGVISVLPLFYVGWSDSVLSPTELSTIRSHIQNMGHLTQADKDLLTSWADASNPPGEEVFRSWISQLAELAGDLNLNQRSDLVSLGINFAKKISTNNSINWDSEPLRQSITGLERALRVESQFSQQTFYSKLQPGQHNELKAETSFSVQKIQAILDGKYAELKQQVKAFICDPAFHIPTELRNKDELRSLILQQCKLLASQGYGAYGYDKAYGGQGSPAGSTAIFETLSMGSLSLLIKFGVQFGLFGGAVNQLGSKSHKDNYLTDTGLLQLAGCFAMTETGHGSNVNGLQTTATYNHHTGNLTIHTPTHTDGKEYIGNALHSRMAAVFCQLIVNGQKHGIHAVLVPLRDQNMQLLPGITVEDCGYKIGLNGVDNGRIWFNMVEVPKANLLNKYGDIDSAGNYTSSIEKESKRFFTMLGALVAGRVSIALGSNTASKKALDIAITYALKRRQFPSSNPNTETLILDYPTHQERLFPLLAKSYALTFALENLREKFGAAYGQPDQREVESLAAGLKSYASWHALHTIQTAREACGGKGYLSENELGDLKADVDIFTTFEGDNTVLMQLVAKALITDFKQDFNESGYLGIARYVFRRVSNTLSAQNPVTTRNTNAEHLLSDDFMRAALQYREQKLLYSLTDRMQSFIRKKVDPTEIFLRVQTHMLSLAHAHVERVIYDSFATAVASTSAKPEKQALKLMLQTYALHAIYSDRWFLEADYLSADKSKAIRKVLSGLYRQIRPQAQAYVAAFGIPDVLLKAKIAVDERVLA